MRRRVSRVCRAFTHGDASQQSARLRPSSLALFIASAVLAFGVASPGFSIAAAFHGYSIAWENSGASGFTGVASTRPNRPVSGLPQTGCSTYFTGDPVYQTEWMIITSDGKNFQELGTGHQCGDANHFYYWGYSVNGVWHPINTQANATYTGTHVFRIIRVNSTRTEFWIDGVTKGSLTTSATGPMVEVGLESYYQTATVSGYDNSSLASQKGTAAFSSWSGRDGTSINSPLCGLWNSDTSRRVGQGAGQC